MSKITINTRLTTEEGKIYTVRSTKVIKHTAGPDVRVFVVDSGTTDSETVIKETEEGQFHQLYDDSITFTVLQNNAKQNGGEGFNVFGLFKGTRLIDNNGVIFTVTGEDFIHAIVTDSINGQKITILQHKAGLFYSLSNTEQTFKVFVIDPTALYRHSLNSSSIYFPLNEQGDKVLEDQDLCIWTTDGININSQLIGIDNEYVLKHMANNDYFFNSEIELAERLCGFYNEEIDILMGVYTVNTTDPLNVFLWDNLSKNVKTVWKNVARKHLNSK